jgi:hypothetical protein
MYCAAWPRHIATAIAGVEKATHVSSSEPAAVPVHQPVQWPPAPPAAARGSQQPGRLPVQAAPPCAWWPARRQPRAATCRPACQGGRCTGRRQVAGDAGWWTGGIPTHTLVASSLLRCDGSYTIGDSAAYSLNRHRCATHCCVHIIIVYWLAGATSSTSHSPAVKPASCSRPRPAAPRHWPPPCGQWR